MSCLSLWAASYDFRRAATHRAALAECGYFFAEAFFSNYFPPELVIENGICIMPYPRNNL
jgi:hypothetical protein